MGPFLDRVVYGLKLIRTKNIGLVFLPCFCGYEVNIFACL